MTLKPLIKRALKIIGGIALTIAVLSTCVIFINYRALMKAQRFSDSVTIGESAERVIARAESERAIVVISTTGSSAHVLFHGFVFDHAVCRIDIENQRVKGKEFRGLRD
jgi:hypothetical protein